MQKKELEKHLDFVKVIFFSVFVFLTVDINAQRYDTNIWHFSKSKNHMILNIRGYRLQDTLTLTINGENIYNKLIVDKDFIESKSGTDINQIHSLSYFVVLSKKGRIKYMYNPICLSDIFYFEKVKKDKKGYTIEFSLNGETKICELNPSHCWLVISIGLDLEHNRVFRIWSRLKFSGFD